MKATPTATGMGFHSTFVFLSAELSLDRKDSCRPKGGCEDENGREGTGRKDR